MIAFDPPFNPHRAGRGLGGLDLIAADPAADELLVSYAFDVDISDIVWMLSQVAPELEDEFRSMVLAKLPTSLMDKMVVEIPAAIRAEIEAWRQVYRKHPYSKDPRVLETLRRMNANAELA